MIASHLAYKVTLFSGMVEKTYGVVNASSLYQPSKVNPAFVGSAGSDNASPEVPTIAGTLLPPLLSNVTVTVSSSSSVHFAYKVGF